MNDVRKCYVLAYLDVCLNLVYNKILDHDAGMLFGVSVENVMTLG